MPTPTPTPNPATPTTSPRRLVRFVTGLALALVVIEGAVRLASPQLQAAHPAGAWPTARAGAQVEEMETVAAAGPVEVVIAGASHVRNGVDPTVLRDGLGQRAYNGAMNGAWPSVQRHWLVDQVVPRLEPDLVVYGLAPVDLTPSHSQGLSERFQAFDEEQDSRLQPLLEAGEFSAVVRNRHRLHHVLVSPGSLVTSETPAPPDPELLGFRARGDVTDFEAELDDVRRVFEAYAISPTEVEALRTMLTELDDRGIATILVLMPSPVAFDDLVADLDVDVDEFATVAESLAAEFGLDVLDYRDLVDDVDFADYTHLRPAGAQQLSEALAADLDAHRN